MSASAGSQGLGGTGADRQTRAHTSMSKQVVGQLLKGRVALVTGESLQAALLEPHGALDNLCKSIHSTLDAARPPPLPLLAAPASASRPT